MRYESRATAISERLAYVTDRGTFITRVDNRSDLAAGINRSSVRLTSKRTVKLDQLVVFDFLHAPTGCATWPAFWLLGVSKPWPRGGEIDLFEQTNVPTAQQYTLHTLPGCSISIPARATGQVANQTSCDVRLNFNAGCAFLSSDRILYGEGANRAHGGYIAMAWSRQAIEVWQWPRGQEPDDLGHDRPAPASWREPVARWSSEACDIERYFSPQQLVLSNTLCGDLAANTYASAGCPGICQEHVQRGRNFDEAYWEIVSIKVYTAASGALYK